MRCCSIGWTCKYPNGQNIQWHGRTTTGHLRNCDPLYLLHSIQIESYKKILFFIWFEYFITALGNQSTPSAWVINLTTTVRFSEILNRHFLIWSTIHFPTFPQIILPYFGDFYYYSLQLIFFSLNLSKFLYIPLMWSYVVVVCKKALK